MVSPFTQPDYTSQSGTVYPISIDDAIAVLARVGAAFAPHESDPPDMKVRLRAGFIMRRDQLPLAVAAQETDALAAPSADARHDIVYVDRATGEAGVAEGTEAAEPEDPAIPAGKTPVARVRLAPAQTWIVNADIDDLRDWAWGLGQAAFEDVGTSGAVVPLLNGANTHSGASLFSAALGIGASVALTGAITPTEIDGDVDDYEPTGLAGASVLRLAADGEHTITGLAGGAAGRVIVIHNVGAETFLLASEDEGSAAANRFLFAGEAARLAPEQSIALRYDATSERWREVAGAGGDAGGWVPLATAVANNDASVNFTSGIDGSFEAYAVVFSGVRSATNDVQLRCRVGAGSFADGSGAYKYGATGMREDGTRQDFWSGGSGQTYLGLSQVGSSNGISNAAAKSANGRVFLFRPLQGDSQPNIEFAVSYATAFSGGGDESQYHGGGRWVSSSSTKLDRIQFFMSSGNIAAGRFTLYGLRHP